MHDCNRVNKTGRNEDPAVCSMLEVLVVYETNRGKDAL